MEKILNMVDKINSIVFIVGVVATVICTIALFIYRKKRGISHKIDRTVSEDEYEAAEEYRQQWMASQSSLANEEEEE